MSVNKPRESAWQAHLPAVVRVERRDLEGRRALLCRIYSEFAEMRGLLELAHGADLAAALEEPGFYQPLTTNHQPLIR